MTDCADSTLLRVHLDHPDAGLEAHLDTCDACAGLLRSVAADAGVTRAALGLLDPATGAAAPEVDVEAALAAARTAPAPDPAAPAAPPAVTRRRRRFAPVGRRPALAGAAAAVLIVVVALTPAGRGAVAGVLDVFRGNRLQPVTVDAAAWASFSAEDARALGALGEVDTGGLHEPAEVADADAAQAVAGVRAPVVAERPDRFVALAPGTARLKLVARPGNGVPADLDGATLLVDVPGAVGAVYGPNGGPSGRGSGKFDAPKLVVGHSGPLVIRAEGAPLDAIRSFVLTREEIPAGLRAQLAAIGDWRSTLPVPVPLDGPGWRETEVAGRPAIAFGDNSGTGALVIRQDPDGVTVVGGRLGIDRALELAAGA